MIELKFEPGTDVVLTGNIVEGVVVHALKGDKGTIIGEHIHRVTYLVAMWDGKTRLAVRTNQMREIK